MPHLDKSWLHCFYCKSTSSTLGSQVHQYQRPCVFADPFKYTRFNTHTQCWETAKQLPRATMDLLTPRSLPGQMPHADLGALPTFLVYRYTIRLPGVRELQRSTKRTVQLFVRGHSQKHNPREETVYQI